RVTDRTTEMGEPGRPAKGRPGAPTEGCDVPDVLRGKEGQPQACRGGGHRPLRGEVRGSSHRVPRASPNPCAARGPLPPDRDPRRRLGATAALLRGDAGGG